MHALEKNIEGLLHKHIGSFHSDHGVAVYLNKNGSVFLIAQFREHCDNGVDVGICVELDCLYALVNVLKISSLSAFRKLSIATLEDLYKQGRAELYCSIRYHGDFPLRFIKVESVVVVFDDNEHIIGQIISKGTVQEMINYTYNYFNKAGMLCK